MADSSTPSTTKLVLAGVALLGLAFMASVLVRLDARLARQDAANRRTLHATGEIVRVNRDVATRLDEVGTLTDQVKATLAATSSLTPLLVQLQGALAGVSSTVGRAGSGASVSQASLTQISTILTGLQAKAADMASASAGIPSREGAIVDALRTMVADLQASLTNVRKVRQIFDPGPPA